MQSLDDMPINLAIELYYEKHHAMQNGDISKLIELKKKYPAIFNKQKDREIRDLILYAKTFEKSERYNELRRIALQEKLSVIHNEDFLDPE